MMRRGCERFALTCTFLLAAAGPLAADEEPLGEFTAPAPLPALPAVGAVPPAVLSEARRSAEPDPRLADVDRELDEIEDLVRDAHFRSALSVASSTRALLDELEPGAAVDALRVRLEVLSATALIALGRTSDARVRLAHAVRANPELELDEQTTSPKVIRALDSLREQPERSPWDEDAVP